MSGTVGISTLAGIDFFDSHDSAEYQDVVSGWKNTDSFPDVDVIGCRVLVPPLV